MQKQAVCLVEGVPQTGIKCRRVNVNVPVPQNFHLGTVDPQTGTWELTDKSLGAGVTVGPHGAQLLTATPSTVSAVRIQE